MQLIRKFFLIAMGSVHKHFSREGQDQQAISSEANENASEKRRSKSRSRVWEKVIWFTKKAKGGKDNKSSSESFSTAPDLGNRNSASNADCLCDNSKQKVRKARSFNYLKRRKVRQFGDELSSVALVEKANLQDCGTATGTFHDFQSERRISRPERERATSSNSLLCEMARGMNASQLKIKENGKSVLSLPINDLSLNEGCDSLCTSPTFRQVRRSVGFSGSTYNSWPRKKRTYLDNTSRIDLLSPPSKQKRLSRIKKRATFSGFDSSRINLRTSYLSLCKEVRSAPHLPVAQVSHIKNQNGLTIGAIHFYKSPAVYQKEDTSLKHLQETRCAKLMDVEPGSCVSLLVPPSHLPSDEEKEEVTFPFLPKESDTFIYDIPICPENPEKDINNGNTVEEHSCHSNSTCDATSRNVDVEDDAGSFFSFDIKSSDKPNSTISAFLLEGECSSSCIAASPDTSEEDLAKEKTLLLPCSSELKDSKSINSSNESCLTSGLSCPDLGSNILQRNELVSPNSCAPDKPMVIPEFYTKMPDFQLDEPTLDSKHISQDDSSIEITSKVTLRDLGKINESFSNTSCEAQKSAPRSPQSIDKGRKVDATLDSTGVYNEVQTSQRRRENPWQGKPRVNGPQFKKNTEVTNALKYSGTQLIRPPLGRENIVVLTGWSN